MTDNSDDAEIARHLREEIARSRGYADFFESPLDSTIEERHIAQLVCNFLVHRGDIRAGQVSALDNDPPDAVCVTGDGLRIGIEVTELVDAEMVEKGRHLKKTGLEPTHLMAIWTPESIAQELSRRVAAKDAKLAKAAGAYHRILLAIYTDEMMIDQATAQSAAVLCAASAKWISEVFLVLSYHPHTDQNVYPNKHAIISIPISRAG